jgi:hypothetical protein
VQVEVHHGDAPERPLDPANRPDPDGAVAAQDEGEAVTVERRIADARGRRPDNVGDRVEVLGPGVGAIGPPRNDLGVSEIVHLESRSAELLEQPRRSDRLRPLLLPDPTRSGTRRRPDDRYAPGHARSPPSSGRTDSPSRQPAAEAGPPSAATRRPPMA